MYTPDRGGGRGGRGVLLLLHALDAFRNALLLYTSVQITARGRETGGGGGGGAGGLGPPLFDKGGLSPPPPPKIWLSMGQMKNVKFQNECI